MNILSPYLSFNGNCHEAMNFYKTCFAGELQLMMNSDAPENACPGGMKLDPKQVMHACLTKDGFSLMASDNPMATPVAGDTVSLCVNCKSVDETDTLFKSLSAGGKVTMPLEHTFWGAYFGTFTDKYGFHWMLNCQLDNPA